VASDRPSPEQDVSRILIIEDNADLAFGLRNNLEVEGHTADVARDGAEGLELATTGTYELIIMDVMMPRIDGFGVLKRLRDAGVATPVLMLSARADEADKVYGFRLGADDYVTKPFGLLELMARVTALLRRARPERDGEDTAVVTFGDVRVDVVTGTVTRAGEPIELTGQELRLLLALARRHGRTVSRQDLLREAWGHIGAVSSRTIDTYVVDLRRKLEADPMRPRHIITVRGAGYRLES